MNYFCKMGGHRPWLGATCALILLTSAGTSLADEPSTGAETEAAPAAADGPSDEDQKTARLHFGNGVELISATPPNYQDAYRQFELAYEMSGENWKVLGNLGLCALKLERDGEALSFYQEYLEKGGDEVDESERKAIERELLLLKGNMATVHLESSIPDARISVKRQGSSVPTQRYSLTDGSAELGLRSGSLTITAKAGDKTLEWTAVLSPEESAKHVFDFDAKEEAVATAPAAATQPSPAEEAGGGPSPLRIAGYVTTGVGVLTLGGGAILGAMSQSKKSKAEESCIGEICLESAESEFDSASSMASTANILFISGGVLTAAGVTLIVVGGERKGEKDMSTAHLALSPAPVFGGGGLLASGRF